MMSKTKYNIFALMVMALITVRTTQRIDAFSTNPAISKGLKLPSTSTSLFQQERRGFFSSVKRFIGASVLVSGIGGRSLPAFAEDTTASGNIVEIEVKNLDGGSAGTIKIQMKPDWAPRGVARFEVSKISRIEYEVGVLVMI
jgi:hypothetical protein